MTEPTQNAKQPSKPLRVIGYVILIAGFFWLCASAALLPINTMAASSRFMSDGFPRRETYTHTEILDVLSQLERDIRRGFPWIFTPALFMFVGGLILARTHAQQ